MGAVSQDLLHCKYREASFTQLEFKQSYCIVGLFCCPPAADYGVITSFMHVREPSCMRRQRKIMTQEWNWSFSSYVHIMHLNSECSYFRIVWVTCSIWNQKLANILVLVLWYNVGSIARLYSVTEMTMKQTPQTDDGKLGLWVTGEVAGLKVKRQYKPSGLTSTYVRTNQHWISRWILLQQIHKTLQMMHTCTLVTRKH